MSDRLQSVGLLNPDWSIWGSVVTQEQMDIGYWINRTMSYTALMSAADEEKTVRLTDVWQVRLTDKCY